MGVSPGAAIQEAGSGATLPGRMRRGIVECRCCKLRKTPGFKQAHRDHIARSGKHYKTFTSPTGLVREVFYDLGLNPEDVKVNNLPFKTLGSLFKGRDEFLEQIRTRLGRVDHRGHRRVAAITASASAATVYGLGGIGKTRAAIEYAHRHADDFTALLFVRADSPAGLQQNLAASVRANGAGPAGKRCARDRDAGGGRAQVAATAPGLVPDLRQRGYGSRGSGGGGAALAAFGGGASAGDLAAFGHGRGRWSRCELGVLDEGDAAAFCWSERRARRRKRPMTRRRAAVGGRAGPAGAGARAGGGVHREAPAHVWGIPGALAQKHEQVLEWFDARLMQYPLSVAVTWQTSFDQLTHGGRELLNVLAWLAPDPIPESLLDGELGGAALTTAGGSFDPKAALADLEGYSLVTRAAEAPRFSVHRLVQDVTRRNLKGERVKETLERALRWMNDAFTGHPQDVRNWAMLDPIAPHLARWQCMLTARASPSQRHDS